MPVFVRNAGVGDAAAIARVHVAAWEAAFRGIMPDEHIDARTIEVRTSQWTSRLAETNRFVWVACDANGDVQGFAGAKLLDPAQGGFQSYLQTLYVHPRAARQGIGSQLLRVACARLRDMGARNLALRTLRLGEARRFYERFGARVVPEGIAEGAAGFDDVVYAFDDLSAVAIASRGPAP